MLTTSEIIKKYNLITKKSLGQNFLLHNELVDKIVECAGELNNFEVLEIGIGPAGLTTAILRQNPKKLVSLDLDERCVELAKDEIKPYFENFEPILADAIIINENQLFKNNFKIIANLPYNIATKLLFKWLEQSVDKIDSMTLMFQKEVVDRIIASPSTKDYGRLSVMCQYLCDVKKQFDISPKAFLPPPKVVSSVVNLVPKKNIDLEIIAKLSFLAKTSFNQRRKTIYNNLKDIYKNTCEVLERFNISPTIRAENLTVSDFYNLAKNLE